MWWPTMTSRGWMMSKQTDEQVQEAEQGEQKPSLGQRLTMFTSSLKTPGPDKHLYWDKKKLSIFALRALPIVIGTLAVLGAVLSLVSAHSGQDADHQAMDSAIAEREADAEAAEEAFFETYRETVSIETEVSAERVDADLEAAFQRIQHEDLASSEATGLEGLTADLGMSFDWHVVSIREQSHEYLVIVQVDAVEDEIEAQAPRLGDEVLHSDDAQPEVTGSQYLLVDFTTADSGEIEEYASHWLDGPAQQSWLSEPESEDDTVD